jgi:class 3 adenylate cyclase
MNPAGAASARSVSYAHAPDTAALARSPGARAVSSVETLTIVFSDLVDSTAIGVALEPSATVDLRNSLFSLQTEEIERVGGHQVKSLGDGVMAAFPNAASALEAAVGVQRRVDRLDRRFPEVIQVRIGMSAGDVECDGGDYFGEPVVEAARLCAAAPPGSILVAELVRLLAGRAVAVSFGEAVPYELKGLPERVPACVVGWEPLELSQIPFHWPSGVEERAPFVGRSAEMARFQPALRAVEEGRGRMVVLTGESGIGKSRIAKELAIHAHARGAVVLAGRAREELPVPFAPYLPALAHLVEHVDEGVLTEHLAEHGSELSRIVPGLTTRVGPLPARPSSDPETERYRLYRAVAGLLADTASARPVVLVLDDLHHADRSTLQLTRFLADEAISGLLLLCVYRASELPPGHPLHDLRADEVAAGRLVEVELTGLDERGVGALVETRLGRRLDERGSALAEAVARETDGNPFFVTEMILHLIEADGLDPGVATSSRVDPLGSSMPGSVMQVVRRRAQRLGDEAERVLTAASVMGSEFCPSCLAALTGLDHGVVVDALDAATRAELVRPRREESDTCTFSHAIVGRTLYAGLSPLRRRQLHRRAADVLETRSGSHPAGTVAEIAHHRYQGRDPATTMLAVEWAQAAARHAHGQLAPDEAVRWYERALEMADESRLSDELRCSLLLELGVAQRDAGSAAYRDTLHRAGVLARELGSADLVADAALANFRGFWSTSGTVDEERIDELQAAREALGDRDSPTTARILATTAVELGYDEDEEHRLRLADDALEMARRLDQPATLAYLLRTWELVHRLPWYLDQRAALVAEHEALARALDDPVERFWAVDMGSIVALEQGDADRFHELVPRVLPAATATGQRLLDWIGGFIVVSAHVLHGDWDEAEALMERTHDVGQACGQPDAGAVYASHLFELRRAQGRVEELVEVLVAMQAAAPEIEAFRPALGACYCDLDRSDGLPLFEEDVADGFARYRHNGLWLASTMMNAEIAAHFGHTDAAGLLYDTLLPWRDQVAWTGTTAAKSVAEAVGSLAATLGRYDEAEDLLSRALDVHRRLRAPSWVAGSLMALADLRTTRRAAGDVEAARLELTEAGALADAVGAATLVRKVAGRVDRL